MRLTFAFTDGNNGQLESHDYNVNGNSPGWLGTVAGSPFEKVNRRLLVYRDPEPLPAGLGATAYRTHLTLGPTDTISPLHAPTSTITVADLLP